MAKSTKAATEKKPRRSKKQIEADNENYEREFMDEPEAQSPEENKPEAAVRTIKNKHGGFRERAGKPCHFNDEQKKYIRDNYSTIGPRKIAKDLKVKDYLVFYFGVSEGLRKNDTNRYRKLGTIHNGLFNVNELENWVA